MKDGADKDKGGRPADLNKIRITKPDFVALEEMGEANGLPA